MKLAKLLKEWFSSFPTYFEQLFDAEFFDMDRGNISGNETPSSALIIKENNH